MKDKALKMQFLQKAIDATIFTIGKSLAARPSKIVAGHEPENTNIWLQAMAYAVRKKVGGVSGDVVALMLRLWRFKPSFYLCNGPFYAHTSTHRQLDSSDAVKRVLAGERPSKSSKYVQQMDDPFPPPYATVLTSDVLSARDKKASKRESEPTASEPKPEAEAPAAEEQPRRARYVYPASTLRD